MATSSLRRLAGPLAALGLVMVVLGGPAAGAPGSRPESAGASRTALTVASVSPWVESEGVFQVGFEPNAQVPLDARFSYTIRQRLRPTTTASIRDGLDKVMENGASDRALQSPQQVPVLALGNPANGLHLDIPIRSTTGDNSRAYLPTPGVHPVDLALLSSSDEVLWNSTVFLNRLPSQPVLGRDRTPAVSSVQLVASADSGPALSPEGGLHLGADERVALNSLQSLLAGARDLPLTVSLRPNTLVGFERSRDPADTAFADVARGARWTLTRQSYVRVDAAGLVATNTDELRRQIGIGDAILDQLGDATDTSQWLLDDTVDPAAARQLGSLGIRHLLMSADRFDTPDESAPSSVSHTFGLDGVDDMTVSAYDPGLTRQLVEPSVDPALRSHRVISLMMAEWFDAVEQGPDTFPGVSSAIVLPPGLETTVLRDLATPLLGDGPLQIAPPPDATQDSGRVVRAHLLDRPLGNLSGVVQRTNQVGRRIDGYRSMTTPQNADASLWDLVNDQAPMLFAAEAERASFWAGVDIAIDRDLARIVPPPPRTVVLTSRSGTIPLRIRNGLTTEVHLVMKTRSPRLQFPGGDAREIVLAPGENRVDVPVVVRASGSSLLRIELSSPDGQLQLPSTSVTVRSSSISGVGAALSLVSLGFLLAWWLHTHRNKRRRQEQERQGESDHGTDPPADDTTETTPRSDDLDRAGPPSGE